MSDPRFRIGDRIRFHPIMANMMDHADKLGKVARVTGQGMPNNEPPFLYEIELDDGTHLHTIREGELTRVDP